MVTNKKFNEISREGRICEIWNGPDYVIEYDRSSDAFMSLELTPNWHVVKTKRKKTSPESAETPLTKLNKVSPVTLRNRYENLPNEEVSNLTSEMSTTTLSKEHFDQALASLVSSMERRVEDMVKPIKEDVDALKNSSVKEKSERQVLERRLLRLEREEAKNKIILWNFPTTIVPLKKDYSKLDNAMRMFLVRCMKIPEDVVEGIRFASVELHPKRFLYYEENPPDHVHLRIKFAELQDKRECERYVRNLKDVQAGTGKKVGWQDDIPFGDRFWNEDQEGESGRNKTRNYRGRGRNRVRGRGADHRVNQSKYPNFDLDINMDK